MKASAILIEATKASHRIGEGDIPDAVHSTLFATITAELEAVTRERDEARAKLKEVTAVLDWLNLKGGLGLDVHDRIRSARALVTGGEK